ncbi:MAG TPA: ferrochelatase [Caulobacteraceae bacterium]|nr:ferrochelatase [Caulobacteraceae bacterium]
MAGKLAVVLFNLGGPDGPADVRPFLRNLFADPAIIRLPAPLRLALAQWISRTREKLARANYAIMGGGSPLLGQTQAQATALQRELSRVSPGVETRVFIAMRYWRPFSEATAREVAAFAPDRIVLAPLYPQFSTTTTGSSLAAWRKAYTARTPTHTLCCWYANAGLVEAHVQAIRGAWEAAGRPRVRLLFSAHGLPQRVIDAGDPYQWQVEATCAAVAARLGEGWDWRICYQSRVGPMKWLGPSTPDAIASAAAEGLGVLIAPIAFVSEHVETLVELDHEYAALARGLGVQVYLRAAAPGVAPSFIEGLAAAVTEALERSGAAPDGAGCPDGFAHCGRCPAPAC